jgi:hypothetical protein
LSSKHRLDCAAQSRMAPFKALEANAHRTAADGAVDRLPGKRSPAS